LYSNPGITPKPFGKMDPENKTKIGTSKKKFNMIKIIATS